MGVWDLFKKKKTADHVDHIEQTEENEENGKDTESGTVDSAPSEPFDAPEFAVPAKKNESAAEPEDGEGEKSVGWTPGGMTDDAVPAVQEDDLPYDQIRMFCGSRPRNVRVLQNHLDMYESLRQAYPSIGMFSNEIRIQKDMSREDINKALSSLISGASRVLGMTNQAQAAKVWNDLETDTLKDAWVLIDYYATISPEGNNQSFITARRALGKTLWGRIQKEDIPELNARRLIGTYREGMSYILQMQEENWLYICEIHDPSGSLFPDDARRENEIAFVSFGVTKDEYALRDTDEVNGERPEINHLVASLLEKMPQDRMIASGWLNPRENGKITPAPLKPKCATMDNFKLAHEKSLFMLPRLRESETFYLLFNRATGERFPNIDHAERPWVYTNLESANQVVKHNKSTALKVKTLARKDFDDTVRSWSRLGIHRFSYNFGFNDHPCDVFTADWLNDASNPLGYEGGVLNMNILRFRQSASVKDNPAAVAAAATTWSILAHVLPNSLFLVPFNYPGDMFPDDKTLHVTGRSAMLLNLRALERSLGRRLKPGEKADIKKINGTPVLMYDKGMFYGGKDYVLADPAMASLGRPMHYLTVKGGDSTLLCCFTDLDALKQVFKMHVRIAVLTWDEIKAHVGTKISDGSTTNGIVINPGYVELILNEKQIASIEKERRESIKFYKPQPMPKQS